MKGKIIIGFNIYIYKKNSNNNNHFLIIISGYILFLQVFFFFLSNFFFQLGLIVNNVFGIFIEDRIARTAIQGTVGLQ